MRVLTALFVWILLAFSCQSKLTILSYNVKNLFDDVDNGTEYEHFDPEKSKWSSADFDRKLRAVAEVIKKSCFNGPDVVALQEVENRHAVDRLCEGYLGLLGYNYRVIVPVKEQAVQCAVVSRYPVNRVGALNPGDWEDRGQRYVLEVEIEYHGHTLVLFNNHWKSKTGGARATEPARVASASILTERIGELLSDNPDADIIVLGDLNENLEEYQEGEGRYRTALVPFSAKTASGPGSLYLADKPETVGPHNGRIVLYETWYEIPREQRGSFVYQGSWQTPDHILLSPGLFDSQGFTYERGQFKVLRLSFLVHPKTGFPRHGSKWPYSDHLPLLITLWIVE
jgi:endonuclease/exonuclease/phosphatase family metal-dependent hydrolase